MNINQILIFTHSPLYIPSIIYFYFSPHLDLYQYDTLMWRRLISLYSLLSLLFYLLIQNNQFLFPSSILFIFSIFSRHLFIFSIFTIHLHVHNIQVHIYYLMHYTFSIIINYLHLLICSSSYNNSFSINMIPHISNSLFGLLLLSY